MNVLALDIATKTGWCTAFASGVWDLKIKRDESQGMKLLRFKSKVSELVNLENIDLIVFESVASPHRAPLIHASEMVGVLKTWCTENKIEYRSYTAGEIKRHATGKGNCNKAIMMQAAASKWPLVNIIDDNQADALWLYDLVTHDLKFA